MRRVALAAALAMGATSAIAAACGGTPPIPPDLITIQGQVLQGSVPAVAAFVYATNHSALLGAVGGDASFFPPVAPNIADGTGRFELYGFGPSYDVEVFPASSPRDATVVQNLTTRRPVVSLPLLQNTPLHTCHIATTWVSPPPDGTIIAYFLQPPTYEGVELVGVAPVDTNLDDGLTATWRGSFSTAANVLAMAYVRDAKTGLPTSYVAVASAYVLLVDEREQPIALSLQPITASPLAVQFQAPDGYSVDSADVALDVGEGSTTLAVGHFDAPSGSITVPVPDVFDNRVLVRGVAKNGANESHAAATSVAFPNVTAQVSLAFPVATSLTSPADGTNDVDTSTAFAWNGSGITEVIFTPNDPTSPTLRIVTAAQSITLAQFPALSSALIPPGSHYSWMARRWPDFPSTDAFETAGVDLTNASSATSAPQTFTFAK